MKGSTNEKFREIITTFDEGIKELRAEVRSCLGSIMGDISRIQEALAEVEERTKPITVNIPKECKWVGFLCKFKDRKDSDWQQWGILSAFDPKKCDMAGQFMDNLENWWQECEIVKLTDPEVYKVSQKDLGSFDVEESIRRFLSEQKTNVDFSYLKKDK